MLKNITLQNFKLFKDKTEIPLSNLNLLTGINGRGKSTVLQSFLLMKQSPEFNRNTDKLIFNGDYIQLGNIKDVKNFESSLSDNIEFCFHYVNEDKEFNINYRFIADNDDSLDANINDIEIKNVNGFTDFLIKKQGNNVVCSDNSNNKIEFSTYLNLFVKSEDPEIKKIENELNLSKIHYVSADRIGPKLYYQKQSLKEFASVGPIGENTINLLWHKRNILVYENLCEDPELPKTVLEQLNYWFGQIFDGAKTKLNEINETELLSFRFSTSDLNYCLATNVGYGFSYILPIIISGLIAQKGEILIIENPEAHLHPFAQSILARFLTKVSKNDVQVIIESHSEHFLNGLRISVYDEIINNDDLNILYFDNKNEKYFTKIEVDKEGGIEDWPKNFFDQATTDLNHLFGI
jgi:predicted ATPase